MPIEIVIGNIRHCSHSDVDALLNSANAKRRFGSSLVWAVGAIYIAAGPHMNSHLNSVELVSGIHLHVQKPWFMLRLQLYGRGAGRQWATPRNHNST